MNTMLKTLPQIMDLNSQLTTVCPQDVEEAIDVDTNFNL